MGDAAPVADDELHEVALVAALAGAVAIRGVSRGELGTRDKGGVEDFVTAADLASERAVLAAIRSRRPDDEIIAEESGAHPGTSGVCWYVDPLDGTVNFVAGTPDYAVSVAAYQGGRALAAVIYRPADDRWLGTGPGTALRGNLPVALAPPRPLRETTITVSRPHEARRGQVAAGLREMLAPHVAAERATGAATASFLLVLTGRRGAYVSVDIPPWDTAAGHALVDRAGGAVRTVELPGGPPVSIAGEPSVVSALAELIAGWTPPAGAVGG